MASDLAFPLPAVKARRGCDWITDMNWLAEPMHFRPRSDEQMAALFADGWPAFISADQVAHRHITEVRERFADLELAILDEDGVLVAAGWGVPLRWTGDTSDLPSGYTGSMVRAVTSSETPNTFVVMAAQVHPELRGRGLAGVLINALRDLAVDRGWEQVIAPIRPTLKSRYPVTPIDRFASWTRPDGAPLDPWIRTHWRMGARIIAAAPHSQTMTGTVSNWQEWTGILFPETGDFVIPDGLSLLHVDVEEDLGTYTEPNVWMRHR
jgi:GNAT superfamily N-acetyltransferase